MSKFIKKLFTKNNQTSTDDIDGGVRKRCDCNAPKIISCTKIAVFECVFSTLSLIDDEEPERSVFTLKARVENGIVSASYKSRNEEFAFSASLFFMDELQSVISEYNFAQFNGITYHVSGLPDMFGATVSVEYESGERIYSANNQDCFITSEAIKKLLKLFKKQNL